MGKIKIVIADDNKILRRTVTAVFSQDDDLEVVGEARNGAELLSLCKEHEPDVAVVDIQMPILNGIDAARRLRETRQDIKIVVLTTFDHDEYIASLTEIGIDGYILKGADDDKMITAVKFANEGFNVMSAAVTKKVGEQASRRLEKEEALTETEKSIADMISRNISQQEIANRAGLSYGSARNIVSKIYKKFGVKNKRGLTIKLKKGEGDFDW